MARTAQIAALNYSTVAPVSGSGMRIVQEEFERLPGRKYPLVAMVGYGEAVKFNSSDWKNEWIYDTSIPATVTATAAVNANTGSTTLSMSSTDCNSVGIGQMLLAGDEWMRVTALGAATVTVTRQSHGTTVGAIASGDTIRVGPQVFADGATFQESPKSYGEFDYNYPMIIQYELTEDMLRAATHNYLVKGGDELDYHMESLKDLAVKQLEHWLIYGVRYSPSTGSGMGGFGGIKSFLTSSASHRTDITGPLTLGSIVDMLQLIYDDLGSLDDVTVYGNYTTCRIFDALVRQLFSVEGTPSEAKAGIRQMSFETIYGTVNRVCVPSMKDGELYFLRINDFKLHPADVGPFGVGWIEFDRGVEILNQRTRQKGYAWVGTMKVGQPKRHGLITFTTTTGSSYAGYL